MNTNHLYIYHKTQSRLSTTSSTQSQNTSDHRSTLTSFASLSSSLALSMAPKKMEAYQWKRKRIEDTQSEHESEGPQLQTLQDPSEAKPSQSLNKKVLSAKKISTSRNIDFDFLTEEGFSFGQKIKTLGWNYFYSLDKPTYPNLVKQFYINLSLGGNGIISTIKNTLIQVNPQILYEQLKIPMVE